MAPSIVANLGFASRWLLLMIQITSIIMGAALHSIVFAYLRCIV